jgi:DNA-binding transcriptional regulator YdaS (Cro superfamily)
MNPIRTYVDQVGGTKKAAGRLGVSRAAVGHWLAGVRRPSPEIAEKIEADTNGAIRAEWVIWPEKAPCGRVA